MAVKGDSIEDKQFNSAEQHPSNGFAEEQPVFTHKGAVYAETAHEAAERGHAATDKSGCILLSCKPVAYRCLRYGHSLVHFDPAAEARLRWKIDLYIVPTVSLLYLFCFIDRANIGRCRLQ